jgi:polyhydroxyalkanoate synthase
MASMANGSVVDEASPSVEEELGIAEALLDRADPVAVGRALARAIERTILRPRAWVPAFARFAARVGAAGFDVTVRTVSGNLVEPVARAAGDSRFRDPAWAQNPLFRMLLEWYLAADELLLDVVARAELDEVTGPKASFAARLLVDAAAPTNLLPTNPTALKRAFETGGLSLVRGARNFVTDLVENDGWPRQVDRTPFELGRNMAATPGKVVYRNELIELIQYEAQTADVHEIPLLVCPPWINRYYIADLAPNKSLVEWAVRHGHSTFAISYRNPGRTMREITFDDYLRLGPLSAVDVVRSIADSDVVNTLAICLGGTLNTIMLAYLEAVGDRLVNVTTLLNSAVDYANSGLLADVFTDPATIDVMCRRMEDKGYLEARDMTRTFNLLRANDLVFRYVVDGWLLGEQPPAFDLLAWNDDGTRMPGKAHGYFARKMYVENALANDAMEMLGEPLVVSNITTDTYIVAAAEDHIVPWQTSYRTTQLIKGPIRFVLTSSGHIAGIVNPPSPKARLWTNDELPGDPLRWRADAMLHDESWWEDWARWIAERAGARRPPLAIGSAGHPILADAPGTYVRS